LKTSTRLHSHNGMTFSSVLFKLPCYR